MLGWLDRILAKREAAKLALEIAAKLMQAGEELAELRRRQGREAEAGDLEDSLQRLRALQR